MKTYSLCLPAIARCAVLAGACLIAVGQAQAEDNAGYFPAYPNIDAPEPKPGVTGINQARPALSAARSVDAGESYKIQPGDVLTVSTWKETDLQGDVVVRPDGGISMPLVGDLHAAGRTVEELRVLIVQRLVKYIPDPVVTVAVKLTSGNRIYVVGKVNHPGDFPLAGTVDVVQALGLAGGTTPFASLNHIRVLRRENGQQLSIPFRYEDIEKGHRLEQNILLHGGDTVVVP